MKIPFSPWPPIISLFIITICFIYYFLINPNSGHGAPSLGGDGILFADYRPQLYKAFGETRNHMERKKKISDWILILLIVAFFAIPVCSLALTHEITVWPKSPTTLVYHVIGR